MSTFSKIQALVVISAMLVSFGSYANAASEASNHKTVNASSGWCYTPEGRVPCPE